MVEPKDENKFAAKEIKNVLSKTEGVLMDFALILSQLKSGIVTAVTFDSRPLSSAQITELTSALEDSKQAVTSISLNNCRLDLPSVAAIAKHLPQNKTLKNLSLNWNNINDKGGVVLAEALRQNTSLQQISLEHNALSDATVAEFQSSLKTNKTLQNIDLTGNPMMTTPSLLELNRPLCMRRSLPLILLFITPALLPILPQVLIPIISEYAAASALEEESALIEPSPTTVLPASDAKLSAPPHHSSHFGLKRVKAHLPADARPSPPNEEVPTNPTSCCILL